MFKNIRLMRVGGKYTIAAFSFGGCPYHLQIRVTGIRCEAFQRYAESYIIDYKKCATFYPGNIRLHPGKQFIIWEGLVVPDTQLTVMRIYKDLDYGSVERTKHWPENDARYMIRAKLSVSTPPLAWNINPVKQPEVLLEGATVIN